MPFEWTSELDCKAIELYKQKGCAVAAEFLEISRSTLYKRLDELGVPRNSRMKRLSYEGMGKRKTTLNPNPITHLTKSLICSAVIRGESERQIAADTNRDIEQIKEVLEECRQSGFYEYIRKNMMTGGNPRSANHSCCRKCSGA